MTAATGAAPTAPASPARLRALDRVADLTAALDAARAAGRTVGLVPTMGALHAGHRSLVERAAAECDTVAVTIFVNPLQFGEAVDLETYPKTLDADLALCEAAGASVVLAPSVTEMYPGWPAPLASRVSVTGVSECWEGASRPGHFDGVATVVAKLFAMAGRCRAYFGEKDFQQLAVVRRMAADLSFPVEVVGCPTVREPDGLAMSSRNVRLSAAERQAARVLSRALAVGARVLGDGQCLPAEIQAAMAAEVATETLVALDYAVVVRAEDLVVPDVVAMPGGVAAGSSEALRLLIAARVGPVRLIDNCDPRSAPADSGRLVSGGTC